MGKQALALAVVEKRELGEDSLPAPQKCTTDTAITLLKGDGGGRVELGKLKPTASPFKDVKRW